jgi:superoxide dismutase
VKRTERKLAIVHTRNAISPLSFGDIVCLLYPFLEMFNIFSINFAMTSHVLFLQPIIGLDLWEVRTLTLEFIDPTLCQILTFLLFSVQHAYYLDYKVSHDSSF